MRSILVTSAALSNSSSTAGVEGLDSALTRRVPEAMRLALIALIGVALSVAIWVLTARWQDQMAEAEFASAAGTHLVFLEDGFIDFSDAMRAFHGFVQGAQGAVDRDRLREFAAPLIDQYGGIADLAWVPRVRASERAAFEASVRQGEVTNFRIFPASPEAWAQPPAEYFPIRYITPELKFREALGLDLGSDPVRRAALETARDDNGLVASGMVKLLVGEPGFIAVWPIYSGGANPTSIEERRRTLVGFAMGAFRLSEMVEGTIARLTKPAGFDVFVYDEGAAADAMPAYVHTSRLSAVSAVPISLKVAESGFHMSGVATLG